MCVCVLIPQSCPTLCDPMDSILPGSSVHRILQAGILEWVAISFSRGSSWPRDWTPVSFIAGRFFTVWATRVSRKGKVWTQIATPQMKLILYHTSQKYKAEETEIFFLWFFFSQLESKRTETFLVVQWLRLHAPSAGSLSSIPGRGTRSHLLQLRGK